MTNLFDLCVEMRDALSNPDLSDTYRASLVYRSDKAVEEAKEMFEELDRMMKPFE